MSLVTLKEIFGWRKENLPPVINSSNWIYPSPNPPPSSKKEISKHGSDFAWECCSRKSHDFTPKLEKREGVQYVKGETEPFTGMRLPTMRQFKVETPYKDGKGMACRLCTVMKYCREKVLH